MSATLLIALAILLLLLIGMRFVLRIFGMVSIPEDRIGLVTKKFGGPRLDGDRIIAVNDESGFQAYTLGPGLHWGFWPWQYSVERKEFTVIPEGHIGLVNAKDGSIPETGRILGRRVECNDYQDAVGFLRNDGQKGRQSAFIPSGVYRINTYLFDVTVVPQVHIQDNMLGVITALDGAPLEDGQIAGKLVPNEVHNNFQDFDAFLNAHGNRGLQQQVILAGTYNLNPWAVTVEEVKMTEITIGHVGVVISFFGTEGVDVSGDGFRHGNLVSKGQRGVLAEPLNPGLYPINPYTTRVEIVPTTNLVLNWALARTEAHNLDKNLSTITVRSKDGFQFNIDVSQIIHIPLIDAPKVIARFGNIHNLVSQVLEPTIGNYFRNSAQDSDAIDFLSSRQQRQEEAKTHISRVLDEYNVQAVDTLIGDIVPPVELMKTLTDRKIAQEQEKTFDAQRLAQEKRQALAKQTAVADMQAEVVKAEQSVAIAEQVADASVRKAKGESQSIKIAAEANSEATRLKATGDAQSVKISAEAEAESVRLRAQAESTRIALTGQAESESILAKGKAVAESYRLSVEAMGPENFTAMKVTEEIGKNGIKLIPELVINGGGKEGGGSTPVDGLLAMQLLQMMQGSKATKKPAA
jgi:uncharacterized membrane protein YqiK